MARQPNEVSDYTPFSDVESWLSKLHKPPFHGLFTRIPDRRLRQDDLVSVIMTIVGHPLQRSLQQFSDLPRY